MNLNNILAKILNTKYHIGYHHTFKDVHTFCMFIGYPRSGHSLIGALLDAHPNMIVAHEYGVLEQLHRGLNKTRLFFEIWNHSKLQAKDGRRQKGYSYKVSQQYQGNYSTLKVIGDKKGGRSARTLSQNPDTIDNLESIIKIPVKLIHVTRNPYDAISTSLMRRNTNKRQLPINSTRLKEEIEEFFMKAKSVQNVKERKKQPVFEFSHEDFLANPKPILTDLCRFFNINPEPSYIENCLKIVNNKPNLTRHQIDLWTPEFIEYVANEMKAFPFFSQYSFN